MVETTSKLEKQIGNTSSFLGIVAKFVQRLGDPSKYEYRGECIDLGRPSGKCTCDHPIRYVFPVYNPETGESAPCGSECINHFQSYNPELFAKLQAAVGKLERRLADEKIALLKAKRTAEADAARPAYEVAVARATKLIEDWRAANTWAKWLPRELWAMQESIKKGTPEYKNPGSYTKFYTRETEKLTKVCDQFAVEMAKKAEQAAQRLAAAKQYADEKAQREAKYTADKKAAAATRGFNPHDVVPF